MKAMMFIAAACACLAIIALEQIAPAAAHGYRDKAMRKPIADDQRFFNHVPPPALSEGDVPREHNWCDVDGTSYCTASWNQHVKVYCGACWAHATLSMLQDRIKIQKKGRSPDVMLGRQTLLNCAGYHGFGDGCNGGDTTDVFHYMAKYGLPDETCMPYSATDHRAFDTKLKQCPPQAHCQNCMPTVKKGKEVDICWAVKRPVMYGLKAFGQVGPNILDMYSEILARGPIACGIDSTEAFTYGYNGGVYRPNTTEFELDHDIEVVGWGVDEADVPYWLVRNSWGAFWGELGFFRLERGVNALGIESGDCWYGQPDHDMEDEVVSGELVGSMYGLVRKAPAAAALVEGRADDAVRLIEPLTLQS